MSVILVASRQCRRLRKRLNHCALPEESRDSLDSGGDAQQPGSPEVSPDVSEAEARILAAYLREKLQPVVDEFTAVLDWLEATRQDITRPIFDQCSGISKSFGRGRLRLVRSYNALGELLCERARSVFEQVRDMSRPLVDVLRRVMGWVEGQRESMLWKWVEEILREVARPVLDRFDETRARVEEKYREVARPIFDQFDLDGNGVLDLKELYAALCFTVATLNTTALSIDPPKLEFVKNLMKDESRGIRFDEFFDVLVIFCKNLGVRAVAKAVVNALIPLAAFTLARNAQRWFPGDDVFGLPVWLIEGLVFVGASVFCYFYLLPATYPSVDALSLDATSDFGRARGSAREAGESEESM